MNINAWTIISTINITSASFLSIAFYIRSVLPRNLRIHCTTYPVTYLIANGDLGESPKKQVGGLIRISKPRPPIPALPSLQGVRTRRNEVERRPVETGRHKIYWNINETQSGESCFKFDIKANLALGP